MRRQTATATKSLAPTTSACEIRRVYYGSTYWLRHVTGDKYMVTADGVSISAPADYETALAALDAVTR